MVNRDSRVLTIPNSAEHERDVREAVDREFVDLQGMILPRSPATGEINDVVCADLMVDDLAREHEK